MFEELILHIGTHKTGTTSIQKICDAKADLLRANGITYPSRFTQETGHHELAWALRDDVRRAKNMTLEDVANGYMEQMRSENNSRLLVSSENIWKLRKNELQAIKSVFPAQNYRIVLYFRRQDAYFESVYSQQIKGYRARTAEGAFEYYLRQGFFFRLDYLDIVAKWAQVFRVKSMDVNCYEAAASHEDGLIGYFLESMGVPWSAELHADVAELANSNVSPSAQSMLALLKINGSNDLDPFAHDQLVNFLLALDREYRVPKQGLLRRAERRSIVEYYRRPNHRLLAAAKKADDRNYWIWNEEKEKKIDCPSASEIDNVLARVANKFPTLDFPDDLSWSYAMKANYSFRKKLMLALGQKANKRLRAGA